MEAIEVLNKFWKTGDRILVPVDPEQIAKNAGIKIQAQHQFTNLGRLFYDEGIPTIEYKSREPSTRIRFTVAHELGHYFLGHLKPERVFEDSLANFSTQTIKPKEIEANQFAMELLVPIDTLDDLIMQQNLTDGYQLAVLFGVSNKTIELRVKQWQKIRVKYFS